MRPDTDAWFRARTSRAADWPLQLLMRAKGSTRVSVVLPARNEAATVGPIVEAIHAGIGPGAPEDRRLVDELVVLDSGSSDATAAVAAAAGASVARGDEVLPRLPTVAGKGEAMWRSLAATTGDVLVFIDADLRSFTPAYVTGLLGPALTDPGVALVKAVYDRPFVQGDLVARAGGGRVTELVARPLLNLYWPQLAGVIQPLAGEYAARRSLLERLSFPCGYGVELALLVDTLDILGLDSIAQVDLGVRLHRHQDELALGRMAAEILHTAMGRLGGHAGRVAESDAQDVGTTLTQFGRVDGRFVPSGHDVAALERPPMLTIPEYAGHAEDAAAAQRG